MKNSPSKSPIDHRHPTLAALLIAFSVLLITLGCGSFLIFEETPNPIVHGFQTVEVARGSIDSHGGSISSPQGATVILPPGALKQSTNYTLFQLTGAPDWMDGTGASPAGNGIEVNLSGEYQLAQPVEIRLPIQTSDGVDPSFYTIYSFDGKSWVDIGGVVEGGLIKTWTTHFSSFWPAQDPAPRRPLAFVNHGLYNARIFVAGYQPDPYYAPAAFPFASTISLAPGSPGAPNLSRYLILPVGGYTFCIDWTDGQDKDKNGYFDEYHVFTTFIGVFDYDPKPVDAAKWITITPGRDATSLAGPCSTTAPANPGWLVRTRTPTLTSRAGSGTGATLTPTPTRVTPKAFTWTPTPTRSVTPTRKISSISPTLTRTRVNYLPYRDAYLKRVDDLRAEFQKINCTPGYPGCYEDVFGMPTALRSYLYGDYWVNVHGSYLTFAQSLETQLLAELRTCFEQFIANKATIPNLDVRKGEQSACISKINTLGNTEMRRIMETSCQAACGEQGKTGVAEGVPLGCTCK